MSRLSSRPPSSVLGKPEAYVSDNDESDSDSDEDSEDEKGSNKKPILLPTNLAANRAPKVPATPAPPYYPVRRPKLPPVELVARPSETTIDRAMNSSSGRLLTFGLAVLCFCGSCLGFVLWQGNQDLTMLAIALCSSGAQYTVLPAIAKKAGMAPTERGVDWKPYFVLFRISFFTALPAYALLALGYGQKAGFGTAQGPAGQVSVRDLDRQSQNYFEASDGFVALNLTKGVVETLKDTVHGATPRLSRFRNAELKINNEPFSVQVEPTLPPGAVRMYRVAPVFSRWANCLTRYSISSACLQQNEVIAWALSKTNTLCSTFYMVACRNPEPVLDPVYHCSTNPKRGAATTQPVSGLCGRVTPAPREGAIDELSAMLLEQGWPQLVLPNESRVWLDISIDDCIAFPEGCLSNWNLLGGVGVAFTVVTGLGILVPCVLDYTVDKRIREARKYVEESQKTNRLMS